MKNYINFTEKYIYWSKENKLSDEQFFKMLKNECSDWSPTDKPIFRSINLFDPIYHVTNTDERKSAYTYKNYYTMLMNNLPSWSKYPKRQHICTNTAFKYKGNTYRVIPFNGAKIGICPGDDIQAFTFPKTKTKNAELLVDYNITELNGLTGYYGGGFIYSKFTSVLDKLGYHKYEDVGDDRQELDDKDYNHFKSQLNEIMIGVKSLLEEEDSSGYDKLKNNLSLEEKKFLDLMDIDNLNKILTPEELEFQVLDYNEYKTKDLGGAIDNLHYNSAWNQREIWTDSEILLVKEDVYDIMMEKYEKL